MTYENQFGEPFPLGDFTQSTEIDLINLLYYCLQENQPYRDGMHVQNRVFGAPGQK